jgi:hypothetical protein
VVGAADGSLAGGQVPLRDAGADLDVVVLARAAAPLASSRVAGMLAVVGPAGIALDTTYLLSHCAIQPAGSLGRLGSVGPESGETGGWGGVGAAMAGRVSECLGVWVSRCRRGREVRATTRPCMSMSLGE